MFGLGVVGASVLVLRGLDLVGYLACVALWFEFYVAVFAIAGLRLWLDGGWFGWLLVIVVLAWFYGALVLMFAFCWCRLCYLGFCWFCLTWLGCCKLCGAFVGGCLFSCG